MVKVAKVYAITSGWPQILWHWKEQWPNKMRTNSWKRVIKEIQDHVQCKHWQLVSDEQMYKSGHNSKPIMGVWSMKRKRNACWRNCQVQGKILCAWRSNSRRRSLYKHFCPCSYLDNYPVPTYSLTGTWLAYSPDRLCTSLPTSKSISWPLHVSTQEIQGAKQWTGYGSSHHSSMETKVQDEAYTKPLWPQRCGHYMV